MYQSILRDPGGDRLVRILPNVCCTNGSILLVPASTTAFFVCNGHISQPYAPGRYEIHTGLEPFFVRLRNLMTRGDPGIDVSVFYVSTDLETFRQAGTGEIIFNEKRFHLSMKAKASFSISFSIQKPLLFLHRLVGMHQSQFCQDDLEPAIQTMVLAPIREQLGTFLSQNLLSDFQNSLISISNSLTAQLQQQFSSYGINLTRIQVMGVNIPDSELARLHELETRYAKGHIDTDNEAYNLDRIYGNIHTRTLAEALTGVPRGGNTCQSTPQAGNTYHSMLAGFPLQMMLYSQYAMAMQKPISDLMSQTVPDSMRQSTNSAPAHDPTRQTPPLPRVISCPNCHSQIPEGAQVCPVCGHVLHQ